MSFTVFIEKGLHAGAVQRLDSGLYTIGSELNADIVLSDPGIEAVHAILEFNDKGLRLEPAKGSIAIEGESGRLEPGDERFLSLPTTFTIGDAAISIRAPKDAVRQRHRQRFTVAAMAAAVFGVIGLYTIGPLSGSFAPPPGQSLASMQARTNEPQMPLPSPSKQTASVAETRSVKGPTSRENPKDNASPLVNLDMAASSLRDRLIEEELTTIDVIVRKDHLVAKGTAEPERMTDWRSVQFWFDSEYGSRVSLIPDIEEIEKRKPPRLAIEAIWTGDDPYLMAGGQRYFEGADLGDGWTIERISPEEITLRHGDQSLSITM